MAWSATIDPVIVGGVMPGVHGGVEGGAGGACFAIENLPDKISGAQITSDDALEEAPAWDSRGTEAQRFATS